MEDDTPPALIPKRMSPATLPRAAHRQARSGGSRYSTSSSITTLPEYTTSPPTSARAYHRSFSGMQEGWPPPPPEEQDSLPGYKSPPPVGVGYHRTRSSMSKIDFLPSAPEEPVAPAEREPYAAQLTAPYNPVTRRMGHRRYGSSISGRRSVATADSEMEDRLDELVERSVAALEMSNHLLSHSISSGRSTPTSPRPFERPRSAETVRSRRRETMNGHGGRRWADEHIIEVPEDEDEGEEAWEGGSTYTGSLPEQSYLSAAYRPTLPRTTSYGSLSARSTEQSLDGYQFPRPDPQFPACASPAPSSTARSMSRTPTRPSALNLSSAADLGAAQISTPSFHPSTPAYKLVSEIVSREALQRRTSSASSSQSSTLQPIPIGLPLARSVSVQSSSGKRRDSSADPPTPRRHRGLTPSISVPQDIGKWIRSLEPRSSSRVAEAPAPKEEQVIAVPVPQRPKIISPQLPPSPPRAAVTFSTSPPSQGEEPVPLSRTITQLRAILSTQREPEPIAPIPKRPQFRPMTPQLATAVLTRPPPTPRSEATPPQATGSGTPGNNSPLPSPVPSAIRKARSAFRHDKHVSFSPTPTEIPSRATSPLPEDPFLVPAAPRPAGWSLVNWLRPLTESKASDKDVNTKQDQKTKKQRDEEEFAGLWRARSWLQEERQGWNERMSESWQV